MKFKLIHIFKNAISSLLDNKFRFLLTIFGIIISTIILSSGYFILDSYLNQSKNEYKIFNQNKIILINGNLNNIIYNDLGNRISDHPTTFVHKSKLLIKQGYNKDKTASIYANIYGTDSSVTNNIVPIFENNKLYKTKLLKGRGITQEDISNKNKVVIIDNILEKQLFKDEDSIQKQIHFPLYENELNSDGTISRNIKSYDAFTVIGVINSNEYNYNNLNDILKSNVNIEYSSNIFIPLSIDLDDEEKDILNISLIFSNVSNIDEKTNTLLATSITDERVSFDAFTYNSILNDIHETTKETYKFLDVVSIVLLIISSISIFNILLLSIKDKISEIGIKKTIGAKKEDILLEVFIEGLILGLIGTIIGIYISIILINIFIPIINYYLKTNLEVLIRYQTITFLFILPICFTTIATLPTAFYASSIKIVDSLRFD